MSRKFEQKPALPQRTPEQQAAAERALEDAAQRRREREVKAPPAEVGGRDGPEPTRYGDWEKGGIAVDF